MSNKSKANKGRAKKGRAKKGRAKKGRAKKGRAKKGKRSSNAKAKAQRKPKKECCLSTPKCTRCPLRMLAEGTLPDGYTVRKRKLVKSKGIRPKDTTSKHKKG